MYTLAVLEEVRQTILPHICEGGTALGKGWGGGFYQSGTLACPRCPGPSSKERAGAGHGPGCSEKSLPVALVGPVVGVAVAAPVRYVVGTMITAGNLDCFGGCLASPLAPEHHLHQQLVNSIPLAFFFAQL